ncbi:hypothetical protein CEXT_494721 [Caerostris extrusa]|uniref:Uncharacterized protein n=1 Tax=Caerostris extrusa TaxID=172846 RepID=A0AAV4NBE7_CAEEX|nr:hypothetical protein CEXT_494721 [Caerostris extrusa]
MSYLCRMSYFCRRSYLCEGAFIRGIRYPILCRVSSPPNKLSRPKELSLKSELSLSNELSAEYPRVLRVLCRVNYFGISAEGAIFAENAVSRGNSESYPRK